MTTAANPIRNVSDTALWVAVYRAMESERPDALFSDPFARRLAGERGEAIVRSMPSGQSFAWPMIVRTAVMDEIILRSVAEGALTVMNLAAGLDTRPFRLALPKQLRWLHVDLPDMVAYMREKLDGETPRCELQWIAADLREAEERRRVFELAGRSGPVLVVAEGLLVYLTAEQVAALSTQLHEQPAMRWWLIDLASPKLLKMLARRWGKNMAAGNSVMQFGPAEGTAFFAPYGWREAEFRSTWDEATRLNRQMKLAWLWRMLSRLQSKKQQEEGRRMSGMVLLERT